MKISGISPWRADQLWDTVCAIGARGQDFQSGNVIAGLVLWHGWKHKTAELYWGKFNRWARQNPDEFAGPAARLVKTNGAWRLEDGNSL
jgi:hypothetical protein